MYARKGRQIFLGGGGRPAGRRGEAAPGAVRRQTARSARPLRGGRAGVQGLCSPPARLQERGDAADEGILGEDQALCDIAGKRQGIWGAVEGAAERLDPRVAAVGH